MSADSQRAPESKIESAKKPWTRNQKLTVLKIGVPIVVAVIGLVGTLGFQLHRKSAIHKDSPTISSKPPVASEQKLEPEIETSKKETPKRKLPLVNHHTTTIKGNENVAENNVSGNSNVIGNNNQVTITPPNVTPPPVKEVRIVSQEYVPADNQDVPYKLKLVVQTSVPIQPVSIVFDCTEDIEGEPLLSFSGESSMFFIKVRSGVLTAHKNMYLASFESPAFVPEKPMLIYLYSKKPD